MDMMGMLKEFGTTMKIVEGVMHDAKDMDFDAYLAMIAMMLEERCKVDDEDMVETCKKLLTGAKFVNETFGKYE